MAQESVLRIVIDSRNAERNARALANELDSIEKKGDFASKSMDSMSVATRQLAGYMAGVVTVGAAISKMDAYTDINNKLKLVTNSQAELNQAMQDTFAIAQKSASSWGAVNDVYSKYMSNAKTLNLTQAQTARLTEITSKAVALSGSSAESAAGALFQYGQALDGGILRAEEYNSLVDGAGGLLNAMAKGLNVTRGELRQMMLDGKLTGEVITKALLEAGDSVDQLFNKTDTTIGQSLTVLNDSITKFVGEAASGSGAATALAGSIRILGENLNVIADGAIVLGIGYITTALATKTLAVKADITATLAQRAATQAQAIEEVKLATAAVNDAKAHLALTQATAAATQAKFGATAAATKYKMATDAVTQAIIRQEAAEKAAYSSTVNMSKASAGLLGFLGGPVGIGLTLATVAAGYMLMRDNADKATTSIDIQGQSVDDLVSKYRELNTLQRDNETRALAEQVEELGLKYRVAASDLFAFMEGLPIADEKINTFKKLNSELSQGRIDSNEYYEAIKNVNILTDDQLAKVSNLIGGYVEQKKELRAAEQAQGALEKSMKKTTDGAKEQAVEVANLSEEIKKLLKSSSDNITDSRITEALASRGYNDTMINLAKKYLAVEGAIVENEKGKKVLRADLQKMLNAEYAAIMRANSATDKRNEAEREKTKELEKQQKVLTASSKVQANAAKYNFSSLESKYGLPSGTLSAIHAIETGNTGKTNQVNKQTGATGGFQFLAGTAKQYGVKDRTDLAQSAEGAAKYMSYLLKLFKGDLEKAVRAYHAGEGNVQKGKNIGKYNNDYWQKFKGYTAGVNGFTAGDVGSKEWEKLLEEAAKMAEQQAELRKNLELNVASEVTRIRTKLADDLQEIDKAGYSPERAKELKAEYQARADNDIAIAEYALKTKLDDYGAFKKTESQLLEDSFNERKFYASRDLELTKEQRDKAVALLDEQLKQEQALLMLAQETQLFQIKQAYMHEVDLMQERYRLEMQEIDKIADAKQRAAMREATAAKYVDDYEKKRKAAQDNLDSLAADLTGQTELYALQKQMEDREAILDEARKYGLIKEEEYKAALLQIEEDYKNAKLNLQLDQAQQVTGALSGMFGAMLGESSSAYRALYEAQRSFALAQAGINIWKSASDAYANEPGTVWQKIAAAAKATLDQGTFVAMIQAATPKGFANGGYTGHGGKYEPAGVVHKGEGVLTQEEVKALGGPQGFEDLRKSIRRGYSAGGLVADTHRVGMGAVNAINSGGGNGGGSGGGDVNISQSITFADGGAKVDTQGQKEIAQSLNNMMDAWARRESRQGGVLHKLARG
ncbi:tape measure protein [Acinetobacter indicus]|uniref:tape measure protein n=1 Tax=Acinetobacter indicus TaxID=756892 RepID=UPI000CEBF7E0|nr:tape measure protein [Acinetobacter indicus]